MNVRSLATARNAWIGAALLIVVSVGLAFQPASTPEPWTAVATRGPLRVTLAESGTLRPAEALTYRSRVAGREIEVAWLAPEGVQVKEGDLLARLDTTELQVDLERATQALRQAQLDVQVAEAENQAANSALESVSAGKGAVDGEEARFTLKAAQAKAARLRQDYQSLTPLLEKGYLTREELDRAASELEQAEGAVEIARRRADVITQQTLPQERQRATLDVAHRSAQAEAARERVAEALSRVAQLRGQVAACALLAQHAGLVVYEDNLATVPRRKIRVGDRVTPSQGLVTIPEVKRMLVDTSVREADLHRVRLDLPTMITLEAYPGVRLPGRVVSVGTVARTSQDRPYEGKRFDVTVDVESNDVDLRPEMTARVEIQVAERSDALLLPINAITDVGGEHVVQVVGANGSRPRKVVLGASNDLYVEVLKGLTEGDRVRLSTMGTDDATARPIGRAPASKTTGPTSPPAQ